MTAFGRAVLKTIEGVFTVEIQSVNRKVCEINTFLPRELACFDLEVRSWLLSRISRGQVTVKVFFTFEGSSPFTVRPNIPLAREMLKAWQQLTKELDIASSEAFLQFLGRREGIFVFEENAEEKGCYREGLKTCLEAALVPFLQMKEFEGKELQNDIEARLEKLRLYLKQIEGFVPNCTEKYREKLQARLSEMLTGDGEHEERLIREIALFAEKIDIAEEITRFACHLNHFHELVHNNEGAVGKTLEFILQELNREANTMGSKSLDLAVARCVIEIKSELEKIREQIFNIE